MRFPGTGFLFAVENDFKEFALLAAYQLLCTKSRCFFPDVSNGKLSCTALNI